MHAPKRGRRCQPCRRLGSQSRRRHAYSTPLRWHRDIHSISGRWSAETGVGGVLLLGARTGGRHQSVERRTWSFNAEDVVLSARAGNKAMIDIELWIHTPDNKSLSRLAQLVERVTSNDEVSRSSRLMGIFILHEMCLRCPQLEQLLTANYQYLIASSLS